MSHVEHWTRLAEKEDERAAYEESRGSSGAAHRASAKTARRTVESLRLEAVTGEPHCVCCLKPLRRRGALS